MSCASSRSDTPTDNTTVLHVPSIGLVVAGDVVYNGVHQYLVESANGGLQRWMSALDMVAALRPDRVVASHKNKALDDDPKAIGETRRYLEDVDRLSRECHTALEFFDAMVKLHSDRLNPSALWFWALKSSSHLPPSPGYGTGVLVPTVRSLIMAAEPQDGDGEHWAALAMDRRPQ